ncbi:MAG TPA: DUF2945 domain-containing protein [Pyrinomonadaceae bacterium]|jgi:hypothetical protein
MAFETFKVGDRVEWSSNGLTRRGLVVRVATESGRIGDYVFDASAEYPRYVVEKEGGGREALHAEALRLARAAPRAVESSYGG